MTRVPAPSRRRAARAWTVLATLALLAAACSDDTSPPGEAATSTSTTAPTTTTIPLAWPGEEWSEVTPAGAGIERQHLQDLALRAEDGGAQCLVVTRDGELVEEWYWDGTAAETEHESWSVTKSVTTTLVGIAQDQGHLDIDQPASDFITEWQGTDSEDLTIRNLLSNDSGRYHDDAIDYGAMAVLAEDKTEFAIELEQQHEPGEAWVYNNAGIQTLEAVLERATGEDVVRYAEAHLFEPLGMDAHLTTDRAGNALVFMGMRTSCRDLARFGLLYLRGGEWDGEQIVSESFVEDATEPSTELNRGYGFLWWLLGVEDAETATGQSDVTAEGASGYAALGLGDQVLAVFPDTDVIVTRLGLPGGSFPIGEVAEWAADIGE